MNCKLEYLPEFTLMGIVGEGNSDTGPSWVLPLWKELHKREHDLLPVVCKGENQLPKGAWGAMGNADEYLGKWTEKGLYMASYQVPKESAALAGMQKWTIPAQTYLTVCCTQEEYGNAFLKMTTEYLPEHGLTMVGAAHEYYPELDNPDHLILYFPIAKGMLFCQSCGMPLSDEVLGTEANAGKSYDYCSYCYQKGEFLKEESMQEMIEYCIPFCVESGSYPDEETARKEMMTYFPLLKRWKNT